jgi:hypothetical protein
MCTAYTNPSHPDQSCEAAKQQHQPLSDEDKKKLGIRECPKCSEGFDKWYGCNHISCTCGAHICYVCLAVFEEGKQCYAHLAEAHDGMIGELDPEEEQRVENEMKINGFAIVGNCQTSTPF